MTNKEARQQETGRLRLTGTVEMIEGTRREYSTRFGMVSSQQFMLTTAEQPPRRVTIEASSEALAAAERCAAAGRRATVYYTPRPRIGLAYACRTGQQAVPPLEWGTAQGLAAMARLWEMWEVNVATHVIVVDAREAQEGGAR